MGRRPSQEVHAVQKKAGQLPSIGDMPEIREGADEAILSIVDGLKAEIKKRVENKEFGSMSLAELTKELRGLLNAIKKPASSISAIVIPSAPQVEHQGRRDAIPVEVRTDAEVLEMRRRADLAIEHKEQEG